MSEGTRDGGGEGRLRSASPDDASLVRHEEEAEVGATWERTGSVRARREVTSRKVKERHQRRLEEIATERVPVEEGDSGEIEVLPDGSVSIPLFDEELVVTRRQVLRERVIVRKEMVTDWQTVEAVLRREHVAFETDDAPPGSFHDGGAAA